MIVLRKQDDLPMLAAPEKFELKRSGSQKRITAHCPVTSFRIFVVLYIEELCHADPTAPLSR
jgi:hypothetical protein